MKNIEKNLIICLLSLFGLFLSSCYGDKGNYEYRELNDVTIVFEDALTTLIRDSLKISPQLSAPNGYNPDKYTYEWKVYYTATTQDPEVIGTEADLKYYVSLLPGKYKLVFTVREKDSDIFYRKTSDLEVKTTTTLGWLVLCSEEGRVRLDMISHITGDTYRDLLKGTELETWQEPRQLLYDSYMAEPFYLVTGSGTTRLSDNEFQWQESYLIENEFAGAQFDKAVAYMGTHYPGKLIIDEDGRSYYCDNTMGDGLFGSSRKNQYGYKKGLAIGFNRLETQNLPLFMLWDPVYREFVVCTDQFQTLGLDSSFDYPMSTLSGYGFPITNDALFAWPTYQDQMQLVCMENTLYDKNQSGRGATYAILSKGDARYLYGIILGNLVCLIDDVEKYGVAYEKIYYVDLSSCTDITQASHFAFSSLKTYMYYSVGSKVYAVNFAASTPASELQLDLGDEEITLLKFYLFEKEDTDNRSYDLIVGSETPSGEGVLRIYDGFDSEGNFLNAEPEEMETGFARIVDVMYRE